METYIAALDQGTTSSRAILFNRAGEAMDKSIEQATGGLDLGAFGL